MQREVEDRHEHDGADQQLRAGLASRPTWGVRPRPPPPLRLPVLVPAHPAVDADDDEEDLPAGLAPQIELLRGVEGATRPLRGTP